ncbi:molybdopterin molybdotransferase MoeA, partial [Myxococcota bacterium]|nr:molybdopterin molybdotransferase MoeA [Myxococcota bacterium]
MKRDLSVKEASDWIQGATPRLPPATVNLFDGLGQVLAEGVASPRDLPPADCSAMDGFAVRTSNLAAARPEEPVGLPLVFEVAAGGAAPRPLADGEAARIFTGAPVPPAADAVVRQEDTRLEGDRVWFSAPVSRGDHIRDAGEDMRRGEEVLRAGTRIGASEIGVLASLGRSMVAVHRRPRVAILSGGDELVEVDGDATGNRIVSSNSYSLFARCRELGAEPVYLGISKDDPQSVEDQFRAALGADCIVSSAGVSVGDHDHVRPVLQKLGCELDFWGVKMKPGYPLAFGRFAGGGLVFGLPGNPVSAFVTFEEFVRPSLLKMLGAEQCFLPTLRARLGERLTKKAGRLPVVRVRGGGAGPGWGATPTGNQSSGGVRSRVAG